MLYYQMLVMIFNQNLVSCISWFRNNIYGSGMPSTLRHTAKGNHCFCSYWSRTQKWDQDTLKFIIVCLMPCPLLDVREARWTQVQDPSSGSNFCLRCFYPLPHQFKPHLLQRTPLKTCSRELLSSKSSLSLHTPPGRGLVLHNGWTLSRKSWPRGSPGTSRFAFWLSLSLLIVEHLAGAS